MLHDRKMHELSDRQFRVCINLFALAGIVDDDGSLMPIDDMAFQLRIDAEQLSIDLEALRGLNIADCQDEQWRLVHFVKRQPTTPSAEPEAVAARVRKYRAKKKLANVTTHNVVTETCNGCNDNRVEESRVEESRVEESRRDVTPRKRGEPKPVPPAVATYRKATQRYPPKTLYGEIEARVGGLDTKLALWERVCTDWIGRGYNPRNITGLLECFEKGGLEPRRGNTREPIPLERTIADFPKGWLQEANDEDDDALSHETPG